MITLLLSLAIAHVSNAPMAKPATVDFLKQAFLNPPDSARPWVYWYFMEGNMTRKGMTTDLEAMKKSGIGGAIFLEVNIGIPVGPVKYMSPEWRSMLGFAAHEADRLGLELALGTGPGWCGTGGPWVTAEDAMQHLVSSEIKIVGPTKISQKLPQPKPRVPFFGMGTLTPELKKQWESFYKDEVVLAVPTPDGNARIDDLDEKALVYRAPYSSGVVKPTLFPENKTVPSADIVPSSKVIDLTSKMKSDGTLDWSAPKGKWTILRFGRTLTGSTTRPAPNAGLGFESDKFETKGINDHLDTFLDAIIKETGPNIHPGRGVTAIHFDSWEMGSQNWSAHFGEEFKRRRGYDPEKYLPVMAGMVVDSVEVSERFLWDLRETASDLIVQNHIGTLLTRGKKYGLGLDIEPYDMNPSSDMALGSRATTPMGEFWSKGHGFNSEYSVHEAVSVGHTNGQKVIGAESFTSDDTEAWLQHPGSMKAQGDWAFATGINRLTFHRYQHQPDPDAFPGMTMGPYGVHWERTETWWDMVPAYHSYVTRCQSLLRQGLSVADILYLVPEGAPNVFAAPADATMGLLPDRKGYNFDAIGPKTMIASATFKNGKICLADGESYRVLVLPREDSMTPALLKKVKSLVDAGATVMGKLPNHAPGLSQYPSCDNEIQQLSASMKKKVIPDSSVSSEPLGLDGARWIWANEENPLVAAPVEKQTFEKIFDIPAGRKVMSARIAADADNSFWLKLNGKEVTEGHDFHHVQEADVTSLVISGSNKLTLACENEGTTPNPAGAILKLEIKFDDGSEMKIVTDGSWSNSKDLAEWTTGPWNLTAAALPRPDLYPSYASTAAVLAKMVPQDLEAGEALRYSHRKDGDTDFYFVANRYDAAFDGQATFRSIGTPEWWDPITGETRPLSTFARGKNTTTIPLKLPSYGSGFVIFKPISESSRGGENFPRKQPVSTVDGPWTVQFDPKFGGPSTATRFPTLTDWKENSDPHIKFYSGKAIYTTSFDGDNATAISLGVVKNMASIKMNGHDIGVVWCAPWSLSIPAGIPKKKGNILEVTVANLWPNRLIGDAGLSENQRVAKTTWNPYGQDSPLLQSGLLGPVELLK